MAADIPAGLGYLALGLAFGALDVVLIRNRDRFAEWLADQLTDPGGLEPRGTSWKSDWRKPRWHYGSRVTETARTISMAAVLMLSLMTVLMVASAVAEFRR